MAEHEKGKEFKDQFVIDMMNLLPTTTKPVMPTVRKYGDERSIFERDLASFGDMAEQKLNSVKDAEEERFNKMVDAKRKAHMTMETEVKVIKKQSREWCRNKKTGLLQKFVNMLTKPFNDALEKEFGTEEQPKFGGKDGVMYNGKFIHPDLYKMLMNRPDLKERFDRTGSIYGN